MTRRQFAGAAAAVMTGRGRAQEKVALVSITLDCEMSAHYPTWEQTEWNYKKGDLDEATKAYAVGAARRVSAAGGKMHFFVVGRVLEQPSAAWLAEIVKLGHGVGNHTYDHVNVKATEVSQTQYRFARAPWLFRWPRTSMSWPTTRSASGSVWIGIRMSVAYAITPCAGPVSPAGVSMIAIS